LILLGSVLPIIAMFAAADHNPQGEFCLEAVSRGDCALDYAKLAGIGLIWWIPIQTLLFLLMGIALLVRILLRALGRYRRGFPPNDERSLEE
jgi:hypothetical protein